jgi:hypothetical protein
MATYSQPVHDAIKREIRDLRALDPLIGYGEIRDKLTKRFNREFDPRFIKKLADKVARQALIEADRTQIEQRMQFTRENYRMMRERLLSVVYWTKETAQEGMKAPLPMDVIEAAKTVVMLDLALLKAEIDTGMYQKPVDAIAREMRYEPLPPEIRAVIIAAWRRGGMLPEATVEQMVSECSE